MTNQPASSVGRGRSTTTGSAWQRRAASAVGMQDQPSDSEQQNLRPPIHTGPASVAAFPISKDLKGNSKSLASSARKISLKVSGSEAPTQRSSQSHSRPASSVSKATGLQTSSSASFKDGLGKIESAAHDEQLQASSLASSETQSEATSSTGKDMVDATDARDGEKFSNEILPAVGEERVDEMSSATTTERSDTSVTDDDIFAPTDERVQTIDFSRILTQSIQITKNEQKKKTNVLGSLKKQVKNFFHEDRVGQMTDEQGNVELPMDPCLQARDDHDSGLLPSQQLFRLARHEQLQLQDRNLQHKQRSRNPHNPGDRVDDYEFAWLVKRQTQSAAPSAADDWRSRGARSAVGLDNIDGMTIREDDDGNLDGDKIGDAQKTVDNTHLSKVGSDTVDFNQRLETSLESSKRGSQGRRSEYQKESEQAKARKAQLLSLCGLVAAPTSGTLSPEEQEARDKLWKELCPDFVDGEDDRYPCDCCQSKEVPVTSSAFDRAAKYYDILFAHKKNDSFTVRFDLVHCMPRFLLHYKFHKRLYDCLDATERKDLAKAATDITMSYSLDHCTLQIPFGKYRTNAYPAFFAYIIVPNYTRYLEVFEVCNPPVKPGTRQKRNNCAIPNWPDKSYVTEFWTYSRESSSPSDKDPRLTTKLYEKNVLHKLQRVQMPELMVTRRNPPSEVVTWKPAKQQRGDLDIFEEFVLIPHQEQPMLGFGSVKHPGHASESRSPKPDIEFLHRLLQAMNSYVRRHINTQQRRLDGREDLSCTVNLSLHHSYVFKGHQRVYGFIGFPPASTYWAALVKEQRQNAALAETAVTQEDIRLMRAANARAESASKANKQPGDDLATETSADRTELNGQIETDIREKLKSCNFL